MKQILVAEDNKIVRKLYQKLLKTLGFEVHPAENGNKAFEYLTQNQLDAIVTDYEMPECDGLELIKKVREFGYKGPIILVSGTSCEEEALKAGATAFLQKPVLYTKLADLLNELLGE